MSIDAGTLWTALQAVDDGETPEDVYARVMGESDDPDEFRDVALDDLRDAHSHQPCREKFTGYDICWGSQCERVHYGVIHSPCPCRCHDDGSPWS